MVTGTQDDLEQMLADLPASSEEMVEGGGGGLTAFVGRIIGVDRETGKFGAQIHIENEGVQYLNRDGEVETTKSGGWPLWYGLGKSFTKIGKVDKNSKGALLVNRIEELDRTLLANNWQGLVGKYVAYHKEKHDFGTIGVTEVFLPKVISDDPIDPLSLAEDNEDGPTASEMVTLGDSEYPTALVREALGYMDGKGDKAFRRAVAGAANLKGTIIARSVVKGVFQTQMTDAGFVTSDDDGYTVVDLP